MSDIVENYRTAAMELFGANRIEAENYIRSPEDDPGEWAPESLVVIYLERDGRFPDDQGKIPDALGYFSRNGFDNCYKLADKAGAGFIEYINAAVAAVYPA